MARTYETLRDRALALATGSTSTSTLRTVAQTGLEESMKYVASKVKLKDLISTATYTWQDGDTEASIASDFGVSDYETPEYLFVGDVPYDYRPYEVWLVLKAIPSNELRQTITSASTDDYRPSRCWTIDRSNNILLTPVSEDDVLTFHYRTEPAAYGDGSGYPEIPSLFDHILVMGANLFVQHFILQPDQIINPYTLLRQLDPQIEELAIHLDTGHRTFSHTLPREYRTR